MADSMIEQLGALSAHLAANRDNILKRWREAADADPAQTTANTLTRAQFNDHIPPLLDAFENKLRARPGSARAVGADMAKTSEDVQHGLQRWQQGYRLEELMHEWGHLHVCLSKQIAAFSAAHPEVGSETLAVAYHELVGLISEGVNHSAGEYARLQQAEAAGHVRDLQMALLEVSQIEKRRATLIHQAVHDLRTNVQSVSSAAAVLGEAQIAESKRIEFATLVQHGVDSAAEMLRDLMTLARLEAGLERRETVAFDAAKMLDELCRTLQPVAQERGLFLRAEGPASLPVEDDPGKLHRLVQNLVFNALKYTVRGGVVVSWGEARENWWIIVKDTGPGLLAGPATPLAAGLKQATASARESEAKATEASDRSSDVLPLSPGSSAPPVSPRVQQPGEGIGLSIVKRLCELLDASLELASSSQAGTTFRVLLPRRLAAQPDGAVRP